MVATLLALTAGLAATASAFDCTGAYFTMYNRKGFGMSVQRLDPALQPGTQSAHLHNFDGGNGVSLKTDFAGLQSSTCTTARIKADKSLYWRPALFWNGNNTGFYRVPEQLKIYYKFQDPDNKPAAVSEFPENFQMIVGDAMKRSDDGKNPGGIRWACHGPKGASTKEAIFTKGAFPTGFTGCANGLASEATFPDCWNGEDIDPKNPTAHMAWHSGGGKGVDACPEGFRKARFPQIFVEFWYDIAAFDGTYKATDTPWVLATGDPTGFSMHADFRNGWEKGVLAKATGQENYCNCGCGCDEKLLAKCFGADGINTDSDPAFATCAAKPAFPGDDSPRVDKLPGCNPIQKGPGRAVQQTGADCNAPAPSTDDKEDAPSASGSASASASAPVASSSKAAASSKATSTQKGQMSILPATSTKKGGMSIQTQNANNKPAAPVVSAKVQADGKVVVVTETAVVYTTVSPMHKRRHGHAHGHARRMRR